MKSDYPSEESFAGAAWLLKCDVRAVKAVARVEAGPQGAFEGSEDWSPPTILYERHKFLKHAPGTSGLELPISVVADLRMDRKEALLSWPRSGGYGPTRAQHTKLAYAAKRNRSAALKSCSWGLFQILGENHEAAGYPQLQRFINAMYRSVDDHVRAFSMFVRHDARMVDAIRALGTAKTHTERLLAARAFARPYNGPKFEEGRYHVKIVDAWNVEADPARRT